MDVKRRTAKSLVSKLSSVSEQTRSEALAELRLISKHDPESRTLIVEHGAIPYLTETLYSSSHDLQDNASATLLNLSIASKETLISTRGLLDALSHVLSNHLTTSFPAAVQSSAATLHSLLIVDSYRPIIGSKRDIVYALIDIIKNPNSPVRSIKDSLKALFGACLYPLNRPTAIQLGLVGALFGLILRDGRVGVIEDSTAVAAQVAGCDEGVDAFRKVSGVRVLADLLDLSTGSSMRIKENCVSALLNLARCGGERVVEEEVGVLGMGVIDGIVDVAENGSGKGRAKAEALLNLIEDCGVSIGVKDGGFRNSGDVGGESDPNYMFSDPRFDGLSAGSS